MHLNSKYLFLLPFAIAASTNQTTDWCFEYDELRFVIDSTTVSINAWERHLNLIGYGISNGLDVLNTRILPSSYPRITLTNVEQVANSPSLTDAQMEPLHRLLDLFRRPLNLKKHVVENAFRDLITQSPRLTRSEGVVLLSRMITALRDLGRTVSSEIKQFVDRKNSALISVKTNKSEIERCWNIQIAVANTASIEWTRRLDRIESVMFRFTTVREIIVRAIEEFSVKPPIIPVEDDLKLRCLESVKSVIFGTSVVKLKNLPQILKRDLGQKRWTFLHTWLQALDNIEQVSRDQYTGLKTRIQIKLDEANNAVMFGESMLEKLEIDLESLTNDSSD